jgi:hypothetical protein
MKSPYRAPRQRDSSNKACGRSLDDFNVSGVPSNHVPLYTLCKLLLCGVFNALQSVDRTKELAARLVLEANVLLPMGLLISHLKTSF